MQQERHLFGSNPSYFSPATVRRLWTRFSPEFRVFLERHYVLERGKLIRSTGILEELVAKVVTDPNRYVAKADEALLFLDWLAAKVVVHYQTFTDALQQPSSKTLARKLNEELVGTGVKGSTYIRNAGTAGHTFMAHAFDGNWRAIHSVLTPVKPVSQLFFELGQEIPVVPVQVSLPLDHFLPTPEEMRMAIDKEGFIRPDYLARLRAQWSLMVDLLKRSERIDGRVDWRSQHRALIPHRDELVNLLFPLLDGMLARVRGGTVYEEWLELLTLMSWASALIYIAKEKEHWHICSEVDILDRKKWGLHGGRIDGCRVVFIGGRRPTAHQQQRIAMLFRAKRFRSVLEVQRAVDSMFEGKVTWEIVDWKWAVGDAVSKDGVIRSIHVKDKPIGKHYRQMVRYQMFWCIDSSYKPGADPQAVWAKPNLRIPRGRIVYLFPDRLPVVHRVRSGRCVLADFWTKYQGERQEITRRNCMLREVQNLFGRWRAVAEGLDKNRAAPHPALF